MYMFHWKHILPSMQSCLMVKKSKKSVFFQIFCVFWRHMRYRCKEKTVLFIMPNIHHRVFKKIRRMYGTTKKRSYKVNLKMFYRIWKYWKLRKLWWVFKKYTFPTFWNISKINKDISILHNPSISKQCYLKHFSCIQLAIVYIEEDRTIESTNWVGLWPTQLLDWLKEESSHKLFTRLWNICYKRTDTEISINERGTGIVLYFPSERLLDKEKENKVRD